MVPKPDRPQGLGETGSDLHFLEMWQQSLRGEVGWKFEGKIV